MSIAYRGIAPAGFALVIAIGVAQAHGQPLPSFSATCEDVREEADRLNPSAGELAVIEVTGELLLAQSNGALSYMGMCSSPAPKVLCVTYELGDHKVGDRVTVAGSYTRNSTNFITLDPCLHYPAK